MDRKASFLIYVRYLPLYLLYLGISEHSLLGIRAPPQDSAVLYDIANRRGRGEQLLGRKAVPVLFRLTFFHHAFKHSQASIMSSISRFLSGVRSFFVLLNTRSHLVDIAGQDKVSRA